MDKLNFYEFNQNNSGGYFDVDDKVCHKVIIQARSYEEAKEKILSFGITFNVGCSCCGDRWSDWEQDPIKFKEPYRMGVYNHYKNPEKLWFKKWGNYKRLKEPEWIDKDKSFKSFSAKLIPKDIVEYAQIMANEYGWTKPDARIYYKNGKVKEIFKIEVKE